MNIKDTVNISGVSDVPKFKGHAQIDLMRKGKVVKRIEHDNAITGAISDFLNGSIGTGYLSSGFGKAYSTKDFFNGCFLLDKTLDYTDTPPTELPSDASITAHAGSTSYSGDVTTRGSFNSVESGWTSDGHRFVWDWATSQGNGTIASICLTHRINGYNGLYLSESNESTNAPAITLNHNTRVVFPCTQRYCISLLDSENNLCYKLTFNGNSSFTLNVLRMSVSNLILMENQVIGTYQLSTTLSFTKMYTSAWILDGKLYIMCGSGTSMKVAIVDLSNLSTQTTCTDKDLTISGVNISPKTEYDKSMSAGLYPMIKESTKTYIFIPLNNGVAKFDLNNPADVTILENPNSITVYSGNYAPIGRNKDMFYSSINGLLIKNGSIYKIGYVSSGISAWGIESVAYNNSIIAEARDHQGNVPYARSLISPSLITTVNNLDNSVSKTSDLTMKLTYIISEES